MAAKKSESLRPRLEQAQKTLESALDTACAADIKKINTGELIKIEEVLAIANEAAKEVISVRRRIQREFKATDTPAEPHRIFQDARGVQWDAFAVIPSGASASRSPLPDRYQQGWLSFDAGSETRRLSPIPEGWRDFSDEQLRQLCDIADIAPRRTGRRGSGESKEQPP